MSEQPSLFMYADVPLPEQVAAWIDAARMRFRECLDFPAEMQKSLGTTSPPPIWDDDLLRAMRNLVAGDVAPLPVWLDTFTNMKAAARLFRECWQQFERAVVLFDQMSFVPIDPTDGYQCALLAQQEAGMTKTRLEVINGGRADDPDAP